jgi:sterol 3beta-glucosyltransferase
MFHDPTIRKPQFIKVARNDADGQYQDQPMSPVHYQHLTKAKDEKNPLPTHAHTMPQPTTTMSKASGQSSPRLQQADSASALGGFMRAGTIPIQRATGYLKSPGKAVASLLGTSPMEYYDKVSGMIAGGQRHYSEADGLSTDDHVRDPDDEMDVLQAERRFREHFALPESERLVATYFAFLHRVLPLYGKIYISTTKLCFRSLLLGTRTKVSHDFLSSATIAIVVANKI